jgi:Putative NADP-dependent oxidoreductases
VTNTNREWVLAERPAGEPDLDCFDLRETEVPDPNPGELLVRTRFLSVDPYMRGRMRDAESYAEPWDVGDVLRGGIVGEVVESASDAYDAGDLVTGEGTWGDYAVLDADAVAPVDKPRNLAKSVTVE